MSDISPRIIRENQEESLSRFASKSRDSRGRKYPKEKCNVRTEYERDAGKILYSMEFRRLRHKTQVFFNPQNDHICTRMEHVLYVNYIANTIGRTLNLNPDLINAIALGHDIGHSPFGHSGERTLDKCIKKADPNLLFQHELQSLRVAERLAVKKENPGELGYNLTFEVKDGIASHCGENYDEIDLVPDRDKPEDNIFENARKHSAPATLEGCVVRFADKIAYVGRDIEDAVRAGIMEYEDIPREIKTELGSTNARIVNTLVSDVINNSVGKDGISMSSDKGEALKSLLFDNVSRIYTSEKIRIYEKMAQQTIEGLFDALYAVCRDMEKLRASELKIYKTFYSYMKERKYSEKEHPAQRVVDFIAGMTDSYAQKSFEEIYWV